MAVQQQTAPVTNQSVGNVAQQTPKQPVAVQTSQTPGQPVEMTQPESIFKKWWFWVAVGIIVLGGLYFLIFSG